MALAAALTLGCASREPAAPSWPGTATPDETREDRQRLSHLTTLLGAPLPRASDGDDVGVEHPGPHLTRVFVAESPRTGGRTTRLRATAWRERVHTLELTFPEGCDPSCARALATMLNEWVGPLEGHLEGRARFLAAEFDTTRVALEVYPSRPDLTRLLLVCAPLERQAAGRSARGPALRRMRNEGEPSALCRPLPP